MTPEQIHHLWNLLSQTWGDKFSQQFGATPNDAWTATLAGIEVDAARSAYRALVLSGSPFPPTLPEFVAEARKHVRQKIREAETAEHLLPPPERDPAVARDNIVKLRRLLDS